MVSKEAPRPESPRSTHRLLENGRELWFSIVFDDKVGKSFGLSGPGFNLGARTGGENAEIGVYGSFGGNKVSSRNAWSRESARRFPKGPNMIICHCVWGKTDADQDTLTIQRVLDAPGYGPVFLKKPVASSQGVIPQEKINKVYMGFGSGCADEIRIGPTLHSVLLGTKPLK